MKVTVEDSVYDYDENKLLVSEAIEIQELAGGMTMRQWQYGLNEMEPIPVKALVYLLRKRACEKPDWESMDFNLAQVDFEEKTPEEDLDPSGAEPNG